MMYFGDHMSGWAWVKGSDHCPSVTLMAELVLEASDDLVARLAHESLLHIRPSMTWNTVLADSGPPHFRGAAMFGREKRLGSFTPSSLIIAIRLRNRLMSPTGASGC